MAPLVATLVWYVVTLAHVAAVNGRIRWRTDVLAFALGGFTYGLLIASLATALLAAPLHWLIRRTIGVNLTTTMCGGGMIGLALAAIFWGWTHEWSALFSPVHGILAGLTSAVVWWYLAGKPGR